MKDIGKSLASIALCALGGVAIYITKNDISVLVIAIILWLLWRKE